MKKNEKACELIVSMVTDALKKISDEGTYGPIHDLFFLFDPNTGEVQLYDDNDEQFDKIAIYDWMNQPKEVDLTSEIKETLHYVVSELDKDGIFDLEIFELPLSVCYASEDFEVIEDLLYKSDDYIQLEDPILQDLDKDLNEFLQNLFSDVK